MSIFHFKGEFLDRNGDHVRYRFQTDYVGDAQRSGTLSLDLVTGAWTVNESADSRCYADGTCRDDHCAGALTHKIRKAYAEDGLLPAVVFHIA